jgi:hypothetical protein
MTGFFNKSMHDNILYSGKVAFDAILTYKHTAAFIQLESL